MKNKLKIITKWFLLQGKILVLYIQEICNFSKVFISANPKFHPHWLLLNPNQHNSNLFFALSFFWYFVISFEHSLFLPTASVIVQEHPIPCSTKKATGASGERLTAWIFGVRSSDVSMT